MKSQSIVFPKVGNKQEECEDYLLASDAKMRYAIADGASDSIFSGLWAKSLVDTFIDFENLSGDPEIVIDQICRRAINAWHDKIEWNNLKWNVKNKSVLGSYSTFIGIDIKKIEKNYRISCMAVGDSCSFILTGRRLESFPVKDTSGFGLHPNLLWSGHGEPIFEDSEIQLPDYEMKNYTVDERSGIVLASDAASKWIMEGGVERVKTLLEKLPEDREYWDDLRIKGEMKNDDISIITISL
ncbi:MAG: PP2C family serine/threonine-protein phosphatase [Thermoplasmataceae archaeon]